MTVLNNAKERTRFFRFAVVGITGSVIDFGIFNLLSSLIGIPAVLASVISFSVAVVNNFILNRVWTFPDSRNNPLIKQLIQFSIVSVIGLGIRTPLFAGMEKILIPLAQKWIPNILTPTIVGHNLALAIAILVVMVWNFVVNRYWTFRDVSSQTA